ncbi:unnamed protein product [Aureobasidium mustum]|uniref:Uncharacterized protein n=1 Tax=Aureobasidium mustum TaxID=2773714 RepID=A0A9N8PNN7_9PEZI|nr:unnamed protein product [Aureobasidium mustum]
MATKKVFQTADQLWEAFDRVNQNELGLGKLNAGGTVALHPTGHWYDDDAMIRTKNWLEQGLRKEGVREYWALERLIAASMEYSDSDYEHLMTVFFVEWERDLKPDGRTIKNKDQWTRWCEIHLVRHHRYAKAVRCLDLLEALGLLYPGWWKQVYAHNHNTPVPNDTYASPWDNQPSANVDELNELNEKYARMPFISRDQAEAASQAAETAIQSAPVSRHDTRKKKRTKTSHFQEDLEQLNDAYEETAPAKETDNESEESFVPEQYYPDYVHEYDAVMGKPSTTNPQLPHTVGFAPAANAWRNLDRDGFEGATRFNPEINATKIVDSASKDAVPRPSGNTLPAPRTAAAAPPQPTQTLNPDQLNWLDVDERDFARAVQQVETDYFPPPAQFTQDGRPDYLREAREDLARNPEYYHPERVAQRHAIYYAVAGYKKVSEAQLARRQAEYQAELEREQAEQARRQAEGSGQPTTAAPQGEDDEVIWGYVDEMVPPVENWPPVYDNSVPTWPIKK